jgi:hypothetical protein
MADILRDLATKFNITKPQEFVKERDIFATSYLDRKPKEITRPVSQIRKEPNIFSDITKKFGITQPIAPLQTFIKRKKELEDTITPYSVKEDWKRLGELTHELATAIPKSVAKVGVSLYQAPRTIKERKAQEPVKVPKFLQPIVGEKITSYARDVEDMISSGVNPVSAVLTTGLFATWDAVIVGSLLKGGVGLLRKGIKVPEASHYSAWESMGRPATQTELKQQYRSLAKTLHPDKPTGSAQAMTAVNNAYEILKKQGIPKAPPRPLRVIKDIADALDTPVQDLMKTKAGSQYFGLRGLITEKAGFIPERAYQQFRPVRAGLAIEEKPMRPVKPITKDLEPLYKEARKYKSAEEFVKAQGKPIFHGTSEIIEGDLRFPLYLTENKAYADVYQNQGASSLGRVKKGGGGTTLDFLKAPKEKILDTRNPEHLNILERYFEEESVSGFKVETKTGLPDWTEGEGISLFIEENKLPFDALLIDEGGIPDVFTGKTIDRGIGYVALNENGIKTKSQLTEIYNQATKQEGLIKGEKIKEELPPSELYDEELGREPTLEEVIEEQLPPDFWEEPQLTLEEQEAIMFSGAEIERTEIDDLLQGYQRIRIPQDTLKDWTETIGKERLAKIKTNDPSVMSADEFANSLGMTETELLEVVDKRIEFRKQFKVKKAVGKQKVEYVKRFKQPIIKAPVMKTRKVLEPLGRLITAINKVKTASPKVKEMFKRERARRIAKLEAIQKRGEGMVGYIKELGVLKGELGKKPVFESIINEMTQNDIINLFNAIKFHPQLLPLEKTTAQTGLGKLLNGVMPARGELSLMEDVFGKKLIKTILDKRGELAKLGDFATELFNIPRALMTSFDMSAVLRQGLILVTTRPKIAAKATVEMFKQAFSQERFEGWLNYIKTTPNYKLMKESGLYISDPTKISEGLSAKEERFMTNFLQNYVPIIGHLIKISERGYVSFLNKMRVDVFNQLSEKWMKEGFTPKNNPEIFEATAKFINNATGRGGAKGLGNYSQALNTIFFSPRLIAARFNFLNPVWYAKMPKRIRMEALKSFAETIGVGISVLMLIKLYSDVFGKGDVEVEHDPRSSDFGKIRIENTRWDIWGGFQQWARVFSQLATGQRKTTTKKEIIELSKSQYPFETRGSVALRFLGGKLAPVPSLIADILRGQKLFGDELSLPTELMENVLPLYLQDIKEAYDQMGASALFTIGVPGFFGVGTQTYEPRISKGRKKKKDTGFPSLKIEGLEFPKLPKLKF